MSNVNRNYYEIIGLPRNANQSEIDAACIRLVEKYRPERNPEDLLAANNFALFEEIYETLGNPAKRAAYDIRLRSPLDVVDSSELKKATVMMLTKLKFAALALVVVLTTILLMNHYFSARKLERGTEAQRVQKSNQSMTAEQRQELYKLREEAAKESAKEDQLVACQNAARKLRGLANYLEADIDVAIANCAKQGGR